MYEGSLHTWSTSSSRFNDVCKVSSSDAAAANLPPTLELRFIKAEDALQPRPGASAPELQLELRSSGTTDRLVRQKLDQLANFLGKRKMARMVLGNGDELLVTAIVAREGHHVFECRLRPGSPFAVVEDLPPPVLAAAPAAPPRPPRRRTKPSGRGRTTTARRRAGGAVAGGVGGGVDAVAVGGVGGARRRRSTSARALTVLVRHAADARASRLAIDGDDGIVRGTVTLHDNGVGMERHEVARLLSGAADGGIFRAAALRLSKRVLVVSRSATTTTAAVLALPPKEEVKEEAVRVPVVSWKNTGVEYPLIRADHLDDRARLGGDGLLAAQVKRLPTPRRARCSCCSADATMRRAAAVERACPTLSPPTRQRRRWSSARPRCARSSTACSGGRRSEHRRRDRRAAGPSEEEAEEAAAREAAARRGRGGGGARGGGGETGELARRDRREGEARGRGEGRRCRTRGARQRRRRRRRRRRRGGGGSGSKSGRRRRTWSRASGSGVGHAAGDSEERRARLERPGDAQPVANIAEGCDENRCATTSASLGR